MPVSVLFRPMIANAPAAVARDGPAASAALSATYAPFRFVLLRQRMCRRAQQRARRRRGVERQYMRIVRPPTARQSAARCRFAELITVVGQQSAMKTDGGVRGGWWRGNLRLKQPLRFGEETWLVAGRRCREPRHEYLETVHETPFSRARQSRARSKRLAAAREACAAAVVLPGPAFAISLGRNDNCGSSGDIDPI